MRRAVQLTSTGRISVLSCALSLAMAAAGCQDRAERVEETSVARHALSTAVFINEVHYDNASTDSGEAIEIAGPAGTDLTGYSLVLYNGSGGAVYDTDVLSGVIPDQDGGYGTVSLSYPSNGIQNGSPDAVALVRPDATVVQFLSYEGSFVAVGGPANGLASVDIGVAENGTEPAGQSLRLTGTGASYEQFSWSAVSTASFGAVNPGQTFAAVVDDAPSITSTTPVNGALDVEAGDDLSIVFNEPVAVTGAWFDITCADSGSHTASVSGGPTSFVLDPDADFAGGEACTATIFAAGVSDLDGTPHSLAADVTFSFTVRALAAVFINEIHYDNASTDSGEAIEIAGPAGTDLAGYSLVLYNGNDSAVYDTDVLSGVLPDQDGGFGTLSLSYPSNGIQNGSPDAVALVRPDGSVVQFLSYEGTLTAVGGPASGLTSIDIGVAENGTEPPGQSLQLKGTGTVYEDFTWSAVSAASFGAVNAGQSFSDDDPPVTVCGDPATLIHVVQGAGSASPLAGSVVTIEGVVVGDFQGSPSGLGGFFVQEEDGQADADPLTSEGIFVFQGSSTTSVTAGDVVRVTGIVSEFFDLTELTSVTDTQICAGGASVTPSVVSLPVATDTALEAFEGMRVTFPQQLHATESFTQGRFGEVDLSANSRLFTPTNVAEPGASAQAVATQNARARIQLDDASGVQNPALPPYLAPDNTLRLGDTITGLSGVLSFGFGKYEVHPTAPLSDITFARANPRPAAPTHPAGSLTVAAFNVLNYFTTLDTGSPVCGPNGGLDCRGADTAAEFTRQRDKILSALAVLDADIVGLMELENNASAAIQDLVDGLNAIKGPGTYAFVDTGTIGTDAIKVGLIFKPAKVAAVGPHAILDSSVDRAFIDTLNRPVLAQTFEQLSTGETLTVAVNHLKSKGSACPGDPDTGDGQGNCNQTRRAAAQAEVAWLATDPTGSGDPDFLLIGDMNAYAKEDPIDVFLGAGYRDLIAEVAGPGGYSYVFAGEAGYLDHALATTELKDNVVAVTEWHINADEPVMLDYNQEFNPAFLYAPGPYRSSDHDPVIVSFDLTPPPPVVPACNGLPATIYVGEDGRVVGGPLAGTPYSGMLLGGSSSSVIVATSGNDLILTGSRGDTVCALAGNDVVLGSNGRDIVYGHEGNDVLQGGSGQDVLVGGDGSDLLLGGGGIDTCDGGAGTDLQSSCELRSNFP
jgi:predicted extracellular nuclease